MAHARTSRVSGLVEMVVLRCLANKEMYGYELAQAVRDLTDGEMEMREGLLYPLLHAQSAAGRVTRRRVTVDGRPRIYYRLTPKGRAHLEALRAEWGRVVHAVGRVLA
jgi:PadR family transcriptional regulator, regulatory protein PadR